MTEQFANNASTTLNGGIDNITTTVVVTNGTPFSQSGNFRVIVDSEIMIVTAIAGNTLTVLRGQEGTGATSHNSGAIITQIITAGSLQQFRSDNIIVSSFSSRPAIGFAGQTFIPSDGGYQQIWDGSQWRPLVNNILCTEPPSAATFSTLVNWGASTLTKTNGTLYINAAAPGASGTARAAVTTIATPSSCQIQGMIVIQNNAILATVASNEFPGATIVMYESASGKFATFGISQGTSLATGQQDWLITSASIWTNSTTRSSFNDNIQHGANLFLRMRIASATLFWEISTDLQTWTAVNSVAANTVFTSTGFPSHYGVGSAHFTNGTVPAVFAQYTHLVLA